MLWNTKKFNKEIQAIKAAANSASVLHPLRKSQIRQEIFQKISAADFEKSAPVVAGWKNSLQPRKNNFIKYVISTLAGILLVGGVAAAASTNAKPGDALFPLKKAKENIQLQLSGSEQARAELQAKFAQERIDDANAITAKANAPVKIKIEAKNEAKDEVSNAVNALQHIQEKLQAAGNAQAAAKINGNILDLKIKARIGKIDFEADGKNADEKNSESDSRPGNHQNNSGDSKDNLRSPSNSGDGNLINNPVSNNSSGNNQTDNNNSGQSDNSGSSSNGLNLKSDGSLDIKAK
jgi:hypothetical protein